VAFIVVHALAYEGYDAREAREHALWNLAILYLPARAGAVAIRELLHTWGLWSSPFARRVEDAAVLAAFASVYAVGGLTFRPDAAGTVAKAATASLSKDVGALLRATATEFAAQRGLFMYIATGAAVVAACGAVVWLSVWMVGHLVCGSIRRCRAPAQPTAA